MSTSTARDARAAGRLDAGYLRSLFHGAGLAIIACDPDGRVVACNAAASKLFGFGELEQHVHVSSLFPERDRPHINELVEICVSTMEPAEYQVRLGGNEVEQPEFAVWCTPVLEPDGTMLGVAVWLRDITKRRRLQRAVRKNERLAYLGKLSGAVAHHYNNLLCSIATSVEYAMNMNTTTAMRRALHRTADAVGRGADLTRRLLAFAQSDYRDTDLADLTEAVLYYFDQNEARLNHQNIQLDLQWQPIPITPIPRERFLVVLENLVENSIEAMPQGGTLWVTLARRDEDSVCLSMTDSGAGVSAEDLEHLFEPFYTSKGVLASGKSTNAGLGLAVAYGFVGEMQGVINASNVPGRGARFDIILPLAGHDLR